MAIIIFKQLLSNSLQIGEIYTNIRHYEKRQLTIPIKLINLNVVQSAGFRPGEV